MSNTTETEDTTSEPTLVSAFRDGSQFGRIDGMILVSGFIFRNQDATRSDIWDFVNRAEKIIRANPNMDLLALIALANKTGVELV